jgi:thiol-disulfide isomerase/thioredoxin
MTDRSSKEHAGSSGDGLPGELSPARRPDRSWWIVAFAFVAFWVLYLGFFGPRNRRPLEDSATDMPAEYNWMLEDLEGRPVSFSQFKGKTVFLNIWATWCGPCISEMPSIAKLAASPRLKGKDIAFVCVSTDDALDPVRRFLSKRDWTMTIFRAGDLPPVFATDGIPATFVIAPSGRVVAAEVGASDWDDPLVIEFLEKTAAKRG